jgi:YD repeat-containing protein
MEQKMIRAILAIAVIVAAPALAEPQTRFYDPRGNSVGTAAPQGQGSVRYFDQRGNSVGTSTTNSSGTTTFYDARGNVTGRTFAPPSGARR